MSLALSPDHVFPLEKGHKRDAFDCGNEALNRYLRHQARQDAERHVAAPFVLQDPDSRAVVGFYILSASLVPLEEVPQAMRKKLPRYDYLPVVLLGRLAVDRRVKGQGVGEFLLLDALHRSLQTARQIGAMAVIVDAKDQSAERFYKHFDFLPCQRAPLRLFLPMHQVARLFA